MSNNISPFDAIFSGSSLDPMEAAQQSMRTDFPKRFWKDVSLSAKDGRFGILLDGRPARTPGRAILSSAHEQIAQTMAAEWRAIEERVDPSLLPMTKLINTALDRVGAPADDKGAAVRNDILDDIVAYAGTDLVCYRAERPEGLQQRQATVWDPYLDRIKTHHGIVLKLANGIIHAPQSDESLAGVRALSARRARDAEILSALHLATSLSGSAVLALALCEPGEDEGRAKAIWQAAHVDEDWNRAQWGEDAEATALRDARWRDFKTAACVLSTTRAAD